MKVYKLKFIKEKETKNTVKFTEQPEPGQPPVVGTLYIQKWAVTGSVVELELKVE